MSKFNQKQCKICVWKNTLREIKDVNEWKGISCSKDRRNNIVRKAIYSKLTYKFNVIVIRNPRELLWSSTS